MEVLRPKVIKAGLSLFTHFSKTVDLCFEVGGMLFLRPENSEMPRTTHRRHSVTYHDDFVSRNHFPAMLCSR